MEKAKRVTIQQPEPAKRKKVALEQDLRLHQAAFQGANETIHTLLEAGAQLAIQDSDGDTPFHIAVSQKSLRAVYALLNSPKSQAQLKEALEIKNLKDYTALDIAFIMDDVNILEKLLKADATIRLPTEDGPRGTLLSPSPGCLDKDIDYYVRVRIPSIDYPCKCCEREIYRAYFCPSIIETNCCKKAIHKRCLTSFIKEKKKCPICSAKKAPKQVSI